MYTVKQLAALAGVSANLLYGWCESGELPHGRLGAAGRRGKILIAPDDWAAFLAARRVSVVGPPATPTVGPAPEFKHLTVRRPGD